MRALFFWRKQAGPRLTGDQEPLSTDGLSHPSVMPFLETTAEYESGETVDVLINLAAVRYVRQHENGKDSVVEWKDDDSCLRITAPFQEIRRKLAKDIR